MLTKKIISLQHSLVKHWADLRTNRAYREENDHLLLMGEKNIRELSQKIPVQTLISLNPEADIEAQEHYLVTEDILKKITGLQQPDGYAAVVSLPPPQDLSDKNYILILDELADPGNLGTLLRTALALKWEGVILTPGTVDLFNDKALRAALGAPFLLPYARLSHEEIGELIQKRNMHVYTADIDGKPLDQISFKPPLALILSNEARGPSPWSEKIATKVTIPMSSSVESLNVASSGAILLYSMRLV